MTSAVQLRYPLHVGEKPINNAPPIRLGNGEQCIPQHYLLFCHTRQSVEKLILDIDFSDNYPIFVCQDSSGITIQIGVIGFDNFTPINAQKEQKIVYGRKWRVEPQLPTSEIIQTVFLAIKSAREHEIRELFRLTCNSRSTTPFNNHHDLPLMAQNSELVERSPIMPPRRCSIKTLRNCLEQISYDDAAFSLEKIIELDHQVVLRLSIAAGENSQLPEIVGPKKSNRINLLLNSLTINELYFQLMETLLHMSNRYVEENFTYLGFARFSRHNNIQSIARLSSTLRKESDDRSRNNFVKSFIESNYETDKTRVPVLEPGELTNKIKSRLAQFGTLAGILPSEA